MQPAWASWRPPRRPTGSRPARPPRWRRRCARRCGRRRNRRVPVLVAYNVPFRDCARYSTGGATDTAAYQAWIDGFARGVGDGKAVVILEPDGLGIIPTTRRSSARPTVPAHCHRRAGARGAGAGRHARLTLCAAELRGRQPGDPARRGRRFIWTAPTAPGWGGRGGLPSVHGRRGARAGLLPERVQLRAHRAQYAVRHLGFGLHRRGDRRRAWAVGHFDWCPSQFDAANAMR